MNNWLPCPKAQYLSPSGRERKRKKRKNGRQRSIAAELGWMKRIRGLGHLAHFSPRNLRKQAVAVAVLLHSAILVLGLLEEVATSKDLRLS